MNTHKVDFAEVSDRAKRLDQIGWGIFLIMIGTIWLVPNAPAGTVLLGTGVLLLLLNVVRYRSGVRWQGFSTVLGVLALVAGIGDFSGVKLPILPVCLLVIGAGMILRPLLVSESA